MSEVQKEEKEVQTDSTEHLNVEERGAVLTSYAFLRTFFYKSSLWVGKAEIHCEFPKG